MDTAFVDLTFPHEYEVSTDVDLPGDGKGIIYQPNASRTSGRDGLLLRFSPRSARAWLGYFAFRHPSYQFTGVLATPNPQFACVVSSGVAYWVSAKDPHACSKLNFEPVLGARAVPQLDMILLWDFITLGLLGKDGQLWRSPRLCWDELQITKIQDGVVYGVGHNPLGRSEGEFRFDLKSRTVVESLYPRELGAL